MKATCCSSLGQHQGDDRGTVERALSEGVNLSSMHLRFWQPRCRRASKEAMNRFRKVMTIEGNWSDNPKTRSSTRRIAGIRSAGDAAPRALSLVDVDCWSQVRGAPIKPGTLCQ